MRELHWGGIASAYTAGRLIAAKVPFSLIIDGEAAEALKSVVKPGARFNREMLKKLLSNLSLTTLPGLMLFALGRKYELNYEKQGEKGVRMIFSVG